MACESSSIQYSHVWSEYVSTGFQEDIATNGILNNNYPHRDRFDFTGIYNLVYKDVQPVIAGTYRCSVDDSILTPEVAYATFISVNEPTCFATSQASPDPNILIEDTPAKLTCSARYTGAWAPVMTLITSSGTVFPQNETRDGVSQYTYSATPSYEDNGLTVACRIYFTGPPPGSIPNFQGFDERAPSFEDYCNITLAVYYKPRNITLNGIKPNTTLYVGDTIRAQALSNPPANYTWQKLSANKNAPDIIIGSRLVVTENMIGQNEYLCRATNDIFGEENDVTRIVKFVVQAGSGGGGLNGGAIFGIIFGVLIIIAITAVIAFVVISKLKPNLLKRDNTGSTRRPILSRITSTFAGIGNRSSDYVDRNSTLSNRNSQSKISSTNEISRDRITLLEKLGSGSFGVVWKAGLKGQDSQAETTTVAVKMLMENASDKMKSDLVGEMRIMEKMEEHPNIVPLIGYCTISDPIMIVMEYMGEGNLLDFLRQNRSKCGVYADVRNASAAPLSDTLAPRDLLSFAYQVSKGMTCISEAGYLHRDLAARNILISTSRMCKVSDFGFARDVIEGNVYTRESQGPLPVRWMAHESIFDNRYTTKSDVWSFGILLWEIVTLGASPYPGMSSKDVVNFIKDGRRMEKPDTCTQDVYKIMKECWSQEESRRPSFSSLSRTLSAMLEEQSDYISLEFYQEDLYEDVVPVGDEKV